VGLVHVAWFVWACFKLLDKHFLRKPKDLLKRYETKAGKKQWALVTGATGDIGTEFCLQLAHRGFNIALVGRSKTKLEQTRQTISKQFKDSLTAVF
jgi:FlaA1/EpsC-like NDP-sugar epimerase